MEVEGKDTALRLGFDIGSTTLKAAVVDAQGALVYTSYERHNADIGGALLSAIATLRGQYGEAKFTIGITGSAGLGVGERCGLPFVQEVVASCEVVRTNYPEASSLVDIGGEDAKMIFFSEGRAPDIRMNGSCAGGTGAFIDQMAALLNVEIAELSVMAERAKRIHPIASRCGVFSKTDIQNLLARNTNRDEIAASIFHAVSVQVITTLSRGYVLRPTVVLCGGPFSFIPPLREAFRRVAGLHEGDVVLPREARVVPAWGAACGRRADDPGRAFGADTNPQRAGPRAGNPAFAAPAIHGRGRDAAMGGLQGEVQTTHSGAVGDSRRAPLPGH